MTNHISELKNRIMQYNVHEQGQQLLYCQELLDLAIKENDKNAIAFAYLWTADYYFYEENNIEKLREYLKKAKKYLLDEPSNELVQYYKLKSLDNKNTYNYLRQLNNYLQIIKISRSLENEDNIAVAYGSIAELFRLCHDYEDALLYNKNIFNEDKIESAGKKVILITNIIESLYYLGRSDEILFYIHEIEKQNWDDPLNSLVVNCCYLRYYYMKNNVKKANLIYQTIFNQLKTISTNRAFLYEFLILILEVMLRIQNTVETKRLIDYLESLFNENEANQWLEIQKMKIKHYEILNDKTELNKQYKNYIKAYERVETKNRKTKIDGVRAQIEVGNIIKYEESLKEDNKTLENESILDTMTKLYNRRYFNNYLKDKSTITTLGFAIFDVDYFKEYNDHYGHLMGDEALITIASILKEKKDQRIIPCRFGGDEFICIFKNMSNKEIETYIKYVMKRLNQVAIPHVENKCSSIVTLSIGFGTQQLSDNNDENILLTNVDTALYRSKQKGRNTYTSYND